MSLTIPYDTKNLTDGNNVGKNVPSTSMDAGYTSNQVNNKLKSILSLLRDGDIESDIIDSYMDGFNDLQYQGFGEKDVKHKAYAASHWNGMIDWTFELDPPKGLYYNPKMINLVLTVQFQNPNGGDLADNHVGVNAWISHLIESISYET